MYNKNRIKHKNYVHILGNLLYMTLGVHLDNHGEQDVNMIHNYDRNFVTFNHIYSELGVGGYFTQKGKGAPRNAPRLKAGQGNVHER